MPTSGGNWEGSLGAVWVIEGKRLRHGRPERTNAPLPPAPESLMPAITSSCQSCPGRPKHSLSTPIGRARRTDTSPSPLDLASLSPHLQLTSIFLLVVSGGRCLLACMLARLTTRIDHRFPPSMSTPTKDPQLDGPSSCQLAHRSPRLPDVDISLLLVTHIYSPSQPSCPPGNIPEHPSSTTPLIAPCATFCAWCTTSRDARLTRDWPPRACLVGEGRLRRRD